MKKFLIATLLLSATPAFAIDADKVSHCESEYRTKNKADNAAAPEGYKVKRPKGFKAEFIAECLSK